MPEPVKLGLRLPRDLHERVRALAAAERRSFNMMIIILAEEALSSRDGETKP